MQVCSPCQLSHYFSPDARHPSISIEPHSRLHTERCRKRRWFRKLGVDHLRHQSTRGDVVSPPEPVDISGHALAPDRSDLQRNKTVELTSTRKIHCSWPPASAPARSL